VAHRSETAPLLAAFFTWAEATLAKLSGKSALAEAFRYILKRRVALSRFLTDGRLEVDNNIAENAMRCVALGRNYVHVPIMNSPFPKLNKASCHSTSLRFDGCT
jgi:hypothetical protein